MSLFFAWTAETRSTTEVLFILYFVSDPESESESEPESESIIRPVSEPESVSEQPHHDSAPLLFPHFLKKTSYSDTSAK